MFPQIRTLLPLENYFHENNLHIKHTFLIKERNTSLYSNTIITALAYYYLQTHEWMNIYFFPDLYLSTDIPHRCFASSKKNIYVSTILLFDNIPCTQLYELCWREI